MNLDILCRIFQGFNQRIVADKNSAMLDVGDNLTNQIY